MVITLSIITYPEGPLDAFESHVQVFALCLSNRECVRINTISDVVASQVLLLEENQCCDDKTDVCKSPSGIHELQFKKRKKG